MPSRSEFIEFDLEMTGAGALVRKPIGGGQIPARARAESESGCPPPGGCRTHGRWEERALLRFDVGDRSTRPDAPASADSSQSPRRSGRDRVLSRVEICLGHDPLEMIDDAWAAETTAALRPDREGTVPRAHDPAGRCESSEAAPRALPVAPSPGTPGRPAGPSLPGRPDEMAGPWALLDRHFAQRGWEHDYGVPSYIIAAADALYLHRERAADSDLDEVDTAILRLFWPWLRRVPGLGPVAQGIEG